jgi:hypothetical protein
MASWTITEPRRLDIEGDVNHLDVFLLGGRLNVVGTDGPPRVEVGAVGEVDLQVSVADGRLRVVQDRPKTWPGLLTPLWWWLRGASKVAVDVSVAVPYRTAVVLRMASGSVVASAVHADLSVECTSGRVALLGLDGRIRAIMVSGPIEALGCAGEMALETVSGEITVADSAARRVIAKTVSGSLTADLDNPPHDSDIMLDTVSGEITIRIREDSDLSVHLAAAHGRVTSTFPGLSVEGRWGTAVQGVLGSGTGRLSATAVGGNIALLRRPVDHEFES